MSTSRTSIPLRLELRRRRKWLRFSLKLVFADEVIFLYFNMGWYGVRLSVQYDFLLFYFARFSVQSSAPLPILRVALPSMDCMPYTHGFTMQVATPNAELELRVSNANHYGCTFFLASV